MDTVLEITQPMLQILLPAEAAQAPEVAQVQVPVAPEVAQVQVPVDLALEAALAEDPEEVPAIAESHIGVSGCYAGTPSYSGGYWHVTIYNSTDNSVVDGMDINDATGSVSRG